MKNRIYLNKKQIKNMANESLKVEKPLMCIFLVWIVIILILLVKEIIENI